MTLENGVPTLVDDAEPALADLLDNLELAESHRCTPTDPTPTQ